MFKRYLAALLVLAHVLTFSAPASMAADGWVVTDANGNSVSNGNDINVVGGNSYNVANGNIGVDQVLNVNIMSQGGSDRVIFNFSNPAVWEGILNQMGGTAAYSGPITIAPTFVGNIDGSAIITPFAIDPAKFFAGALEIARAEGQDTAAIINNGTFNLSKDNFLALIGSAAINNGTINANGGTVVLAAGDKVSLDLTNGAGLIKVAIDEAVSAPVFDANGNKIADAISNTGKIKADGGVAILSAKALEGIFDSVINHTGIIEANSVSSQNGRILLDGGDKGIVSVTGTMNAIGDDLGETGGRIEVLGEKLGLFDGASLNASGMSGGGEVYIGGGYQGLGDLPHAAAVFLSKWADINVDATLEGNGGTVVLWSDNSTKAYGTISARGGVLSGDGGLIETSSANALDVEGIGIDASAQSSTGKAGTWLIDPLNVNISNGATTGYPAIPPGSGFFIPNASGANINAADINTKLNAGTNVDVTTGSTGVEAGNITVNAAITKNAGAQATLNLTAAGAITISQQITASGAAKLNFGAFAGGLITVGNSILTNGGNATLTSSGGGININQQIQTNGGAATFQASGNINVDNGIQTNGGAALFQSNNGTIDVNQQVSTNGGSASFYANNGTISVDNGILTNNGTATFSSNAFNSTQQVNAGNGTVDITADTASIGNSIQTTGVIKVQNKTAGTTIGLGGGTGTLNLTQTEVSNLQNAASLEFGSSTAGNVKVDNIATTRNRMIIRTGGSVTEEGAGDVNTDILVGTSGVGSLGIESGTGVNVDVDVTNLGVNNSASGAIDIQDTAGGVMVNAITNSGATINGVTNANGGNITLEAAGAGSDLTLSSSVSTTGDVSLKANDLINQTAGTVSANDLTFNTTAGTGNVTLNQTGNSFDSVTGTAGGNVNIKDSGKTAVELKAITAVGKTITYEHAGLVTDSVTVTGNITSGSGAVNGGAINLKSSGQMTVNNTSTISSAIGSGGILSVTGAVVNGTLNVGAGNITLFAAGIDTIINTPINQAINVVLSAIRDIILQTSITTTGGANVTLNADSDNNGVGGLWLQNGSSINSDGDVNLNGSAINDAGAAGESIRLDAGSSITAQGDINFTNNSNAPAGADVVVNGTVATSGSGKTINIDSNDNLTTSNDGAANLTGENIVLSAGNNIDAEIDAENLSLTTTTGNITAEDFQDGFTLTGFSNPGSGVLTLITHSPMTIAADLIQAATINITATESADVDDHVVVNAGVTVQSTAGDVNITAGDDVNANGTLIRSDAGAVNITAGSGDTDNIGTINLNGNVQAGTTTTLNANTAASGAITQASGAVTTSNLALNASTSANLSQAGNNVTGSLTANTGTDLTFTDTNALDLGASTVGGVLNVTAGGAITDSGDIAVTNGATFNAGANTINLGGATEATNFGSLNLTGTTVVIQEDSATDLAGVSASSLNLTSAGDITDSGNLSVTGLTELDAAAGASNITLGSAGETTNFGTLNVRGNTVTVEEDSATDLAGAIANTLNVTSNGAITDSGNLAVTGAATFNAGANDITLGSAGETTNFGQLNVTGNNVTVEEDSAMILTGVNASSLNLQVSGNLTDGGNVNVTGATTLAVAGDITLDNANDFGSVAVTNGNNVTLNDTNGINIDNSTIGGFLNVTAGGLIDFIGNAATTIATTMNLTTTAGGITDSGTGVVVVTGTTTLNSGATDITLNNAANDFSSVGITNANNVTLNDTNALAFNASTVGGTLNVTTNGAITDNGALTVTGATTLAAGAANDITLDNANDFSSVGITSGNNVTLNDANALALNASTVSGTLNVTTNGVITDNGALTVTGATTLAAGAANDITLDNANDFSSVGITSGNNVTLNDANALALNASTVSGTLNVTANGAITDNGDLTVTGATTLNSGAANDITLDNNNNFSAVTVTAANNVTLNDTNAINIDNSTISGFLNVTAGGLIDFIGNAATTVGAMMNLTTTTGGIADSGTGTLAVTNGAILDAGAANDITLDNANNFSAVKVNAGNNVTINDVNAVNFDNSTISGFFTVTAGGLIDFIGNAVTAVTGAMNLTATNGSIIDSGTGSLSVTGTTTLNVTPAGFSVSLNNTANDFSTVAITNAEDVTLNDANGIDLGVSTVTGDLNVTANGNITQSGVITANTVAKTATFNATGNDVTLDTFSNDFTTVSLNNVNEAFVKDANALNLGASSFDSLEVTTGGDLTDSGNIVSTQLVKITAGANNVFLDEAGNDFNQVQVVSSGNAQFVDANDIDVAASTVTGNLKLTTAGAITDSGDITATGLELAAGTTVTLDQAGNDFNTVAGTSNGNISITDADDLTVGAVGASTGLNSGGASGDITLNTGNLITLANNVTANGGTGTLTLNTTAGGVNQTGGIVDANELLMLGAGTYSLLQNNNVDRIAANVTGPVSFKDGVNGFTVDTVGATNGIVTNNGNVSLEALTDITVTQAVNAGTADATLTAGGFIREGVADDGAPVADVIAKNIFLNSNVASPADAIGVSTGYFDIQVTDSATGSFNIGVPNSGNVYLNCIGDCPIGQVNVGTATFNFSLSGALLDGNDDPDASGEFNGGVWNITAGGINIKTGTGFGTATDAIELRLSDFGGAANSDGRMAVDGGTGGVFAVNASQTGAGLTIGAIAGSFVAGTSSQAGQIIFSGSPLTIAANVVDTLGGNIQLAALGATAADNIDVNADITASGGNGNVELIAGNSVNLNAGSDISVAGTGVVNVRAGEDFTDTTVDQDGAATGSVSMDAASTITTAGGNILLDAAADVVVATANAGAGLARLLARSGSVNGAATNLVTAGTIDADAVTGIGNTQSLSTAASTITADTTNGNVVINNALATAVNATSLTTGTGLVDFDQSGGGSLTVGTASTTDGAVTIANTGGDLTVGGSVTAGGANNITLTTMTSGEIILTGTTTADGDTANINSAASINGAGLVTAGTANLDAANGIGNTTALNTAASTVTADSATGSIDINNNLATATDANSLTTTTGTITFDQTGGGALTVTNATTTEGTININVDSANLTATNVVAGGSAKNVNLTTTTSGDILINTVTANGDTVTATSVGSINGTSNANLTTAGAIDFNAAAGIGNTEAMNTVASLINADTTNGNIDINNNLAFPVTANSLTTGTGTIKFDQTGGGELTVTNATTGDGQIDITNTGGNIIATNVVAGGTANANLTTITSGNINVGKVEALGDTANISSAGAIFGITDDNTADVSAGTINLNAAVGGIRGAAAGMALDVTATTALNADTAAGDDSDITIDSIIDLPIGLVNAGAGVVNLFSLGNMTDANDGGTPDAPAVTNIIGSTINLVALVGGIGSASNFVDFLASTRFNARTDLGFGGDDGNIFVRSTGDAPIGVINAGLGQVTLTSQGNITDADLDTAANVLASVINLNTLGSDIGVAGSLNNYFDIQITDPVGGVWNASTQGGDLYVNCIGVCPTGLVDLGTGNGYLAVGTMIDGNDDLFGEFATPVAASVNLIAGGFEIDSDAGVGTAIDAIEMRLGDFGGVAGHGRFIADGGTGGIFATNSRPVLPGTFGLDLNTLPGGLLTSVTAADDIVILSGSPLDISVNVTGGADVTLAALGAALTDDATIKDNITVSSTGAGTVTIAAGHTVFANAGAVVSTTGTGLVNILAGENLTDSLTVFNQDGNVDGSVDMNATSAFRSQDGNILVDARNNASISEVNADSNAAGIRGDVTVRARTGAIGDRNAALVNITADDTVLRANTGIADSAVLDDNELETNTVTVDLINNTSGNVNVVEVAAGGNLDVLRANQNGAGNLNIRTDDGSMTIVSAGATPAGFGVSATSGITNLIVNDADNSANHDLNINNTVTSTTGRINLQSNSRDIVADVNGDVTATTGAEIEANAVRNVTMADGTVWNANAGGDGTVNGGDLGVGIDVTAQNGDVTLGSVQTTSTAATSRGDAFDAVTIRAANGAVIDGGDTDANIVANSGETKILAENGIGSGNSLEVELDRLTADNIGVAPSNDIDIRETANGGALNLVHVLQQAATGRIDIQTLNGTLTVLTEAAGVGAFTANGVAGLAGQIFLIANGAGANDDLVINNQIESTTGKINLDSTSRDVIADAEGDVIATGGAEIESAAQRHITMANGTVWNATSGGTGGETGDLGVGIDLNANQNITLGLVRTSSEALVAVDIASANGAIIDAAADGVDTDAENLDIITGNVTGRATLTAQDGIGSTNALETSIGQVDAVNGLPFLGSGNTRIREVVSGGDLDIIRSNQFALTGQNDIRTENGDLTVVDNNLGGLGVLSLGGQTFLFSQDSDASGGDHLIVNNTVQSVTGKINLDSMHDVQFSVEGDVTSGTGEIEVDATDFLTMSEDAGLNDQTVLSTLTGRIDLDAGNNITLSQVSTGSTLSDAIVINTRNGRIIDAGDVDSGGLLGAFDIRTGAQAEDPTIFDGGLILTAFNGIGIKDAVLDPFGGLETKVGQLSARNVVDDIQIFNTGALRITTLTDNDPTTSLGFVNAVPTVPGVVVDTVADSIIFITAASPMEVNSAVLNNGGGNITLFSLGNLTTDTMSINADVRSTGANGNILITSGGTMTQANGTVVRTTGDGVTPGLGNIIMAAGVDSTGALDVPSGSFPAVDLTRDGNATADLIMGATAAVRTDGGTLGGGADPGNGTITMNAERNLLIAEVNADSNGDNLRGNVFTNSFTGDTLDSQLDGNGNAPILNITADVLTMFSAGIIGFPNDPIETNAQIINAFAFGGIALDNMISSVVNIVAQNGNIQFRNIGSIFFGGIHANNGDNFISSTQSFIAVDNGNHITGNNIRLAAGGNIGTAANPINLNLLNGSGQVQLNVGGSTDNVSAFIRGNFTADQVEQLNTAPGLIFLNGIAIGGGNISQLDTALADIFSESNRLNNPFVDYPGYGNTDRLAFGPAIGIDTSAIDALPTLETLPPTVVPIPEEAETEEQRKARTAAPDTKQPAVPAVQGQNPPTVVPIPAEAVGTLEPEVEQNAQ